MGWLAFSFQAMIELYYSRLIKRMVSLFVSCLCSSCIMAGYRKGWFDSSFHEYVRAVLQEVKKKDCQLIRFMSMFELYCSRLKKGMVSFFISSYVRSFLWQVKEKGQLASSCYVYVGAVLQQVEEKGWLASSFHIYVRAV